MHHDFWYISLPSLHDYIVKLPNFTFCRGREQKKTTFFFFSWTLMQFFRIQPPQNICQHLANETRWNKRDQVWGNANSLFKWRFRSRRRRRRRRRCANSPISLSEASPGQKTGLNRKNIGERSEPSGGLLWRGEMAATLSTSQTTSRLASLADFIFAHGYFFSLLPPIVEPVAGPVNVFCRIFSPYMSIDI